MLAKYRQSDSYLTQTEVNNFNIMNIILLGNTVCTMIDITCTKKMSFLIINFQSQDILITNNVISIPVCNKLHMLAHVFQ